MNLSGKFAILGIKPISKNSKHSHSFLSFQSFIFFDLFWFCFMNRELKLSLIRLLSFEYEPTPGPLFF